MEKKKRFIVSSEILRSLIESHDDGDSLVPISKINKDIFDRNNFKLSKEELLEVEEFLNFSCKRKVIEFRLIPTMFGIDEQGIYTNCRKSYLTFTKDGLDAEISKIELVNKNSDASVYCQSSKIALASSNQTTNTNISKMANMMSEKGFHRVSYDTVIGQIVDNTKQFVVREKWDINDKQGFSWFLGMICKAATMSHKSFADKYDPLFIDSFNNHFYT
jgi:hypothetical protein